MQTCHSYLAGQLVRSRKELHINSHSVIPAPRTTRTPSERAASSGWLSTTLLHPIMSELGRH